MDLCEFEIGHNPLILDLTYLPRLTSMRRIRVSAVHSHLLVFWDNRQILQTEQKRDERKKPYF